MFLEMIDCPMTLAYCCCIFFFFKLKVLLVLLNCPSSGIESSKTLSTH